MLPYLGVLSVAMLSTGLAAETVVTAVEGIAPVVQLPERRYRNKGKQARPAKRSNRLHISRRTRRKHRRAA